jgi:type I restriction enzyme S subunit
MKSAPESREVAWAMQPFPECLDKLGISRPAKLFARDYKPAGTVPVIDQGQEFIAGWTNDETLAIRDNLPFIVFGDHTRAFKFVNFPFALGADGTQLLKPNPEFNPRFFYYACIQLNLPNRGYNRHFTLLKEQSLPMPPKPEQEKIAAVLWKVQRAIEVEAKLTTAARELKQSAMRQLFTHGLRNENRKETDIGRIPKSWRVCSLSDIAKLERGRFMYRPRNEPRFYGGKTPFVQTGDVVRSQGWIRNHTQTLTDEGVAISRVFPRGTILITIAANIGFSGILDFDCACPDSLIGITPGSEVNNWYLEYYLQTQQADMDRKAPKGTQKNINIQFLTPWPVIVPSLNEQKEMAGILQTIDRKISIHDRKRAALSDLFQTLLHQLMTAQIRVDKLDIDTREVTA